MIDNIIIIKQRQINFCSLGDPGLDVGSALPLLGKVEGIHQVGIADKMSLGVTYDLAVISLEQIETALQEVGFHLDNSLICRFQRALYYFTEENERSNLGLGKLTCCRDCAIKIFAAHYRSTRHGCRDSRPEHLRRYL